MNVRDVMTKDVVIVTPDTEVDQIARLLVDNDISGVPVVDVAGRVVGMVTEGDLIVRNASLHLPHFWQFLDARFYLEPPRHYEQELRRMLATVAREIMTEPVITVGPDEDVRAAATLMVEQKVNPIPVVENGQLVGVISRSDIVRLMARPPAE